MNVKKIPLIFFILFVIICPIMQFKGISSFHQLPSGIYGADYYYQMGSVNHIRYGGNPFESSSMEGGIPGYFPLYGILCAGFCNVFNFDTLHGMLYFSIVVFVMACIVWFYLFRTLFKNDWIALIGVLLANGNLMPILKYTPFTSQIMVPLFILSLYMVFKERKIEYYVLLGIIYGLFAISHMVAFIGATIILFVFLIYQLFEMYHANNIPSKNLKNTTINELIKKWGLLGLISAPLLLLYWYKPLFVYHLKMGYYDRVHMDTPDFARFDVQISFLINTIKKYLFKFNTLKSGIVSALIVFGVFGYLTSENSTLKKFFAVLLAGSLFATFSYFITEPLLHMNFIPTYMSGFYINSCMLIFSLFGLSYAGRFMKGNDSILYVLLFLVLFTNSLYNYDNYLQNDKWVVNIGKYYLPPQYIELEKYLINNTDLNDVILSTKELSFAVNSVSGRKVMVNKWAQTANPYENMPERDMDASIILYGNDTKEKLKLIKKYNVKYIYWNIYWTNSEYIYNKSTMDIISYRDFLLTLDTPENRKKLDKYNVSYYPEHTWMDPACAGEHIRKFDILIISPKNYYNNTNPWKPDLNQYLEEVWSYSENGQKIAVLYKVKVYDDE